MSDDKELADGIKSATQPDALATQPDAVSTPQNMVATQQSDNVAHEQRVLRAARLGAIGSICQAISSALAIAISCYALYLTISFKRDDSRSEEAKVAPVVRVYFDPEKLELGFYNGGLGPAFVEHVTVVAGGKRASVGWNEKTNSSIRDMFKGADELTNSILARPNRFARTVNSPNAVIHSQTSLPYPGTIIGTNVKSPVFWVADIAELKQQFETNAAYSAWLSGFGSNDNVVDIELCYCSVLHKDCRVSHFLRIQDQLVASCPPA